MFNKKKDNTEEKQINKDAPDGTIEAPPLKPFSGKAKHSPSKPPVSTAFQPDITRRQSDFPSAARLRTERSLGSSYDSRRLVVGRDIRLKGEITACDKLLVEGHVEIVLPEAGSIEIASSGFFKGKAEVNEADISGNFDKRALGTIPAITTNRSVKFVPFSNLKYNVQIKLLNQDQEFYKFF